MLGTALNVRADMADKWVILRELIPRLGRISIGNRMNESAIKDFNVLLVIFENFSQN